MKKYFLITILFAIVTKGSELSLKQVNIPSVDEADLLNRINNLYHNILKFKEVIDIVSLDPLRILDLTYFILKNENIFIREAAQIKAFQDFDNWLGKIVINLLEYIKRWKTTTTLISTASTTSKKISLPSTSSTTSSSTIGAITNITINKTTRIPTTTNATNTTNICILTTTSYPDLNTNKTTKETTIISRKTTTIWTTMTYFHTTTTKFFIDVKYCKRFTPTDCYETAQDSGKPINIVPFVCKKLCNSNWIT